MTASYGIFPSLLTLNEGKVLQTMFHLSGVADGTVLYWSLGGSGISASDFDAELRMVVIDPLAQFTSIRAAETFF